VRFESVCALRVFGDVRLHWGVWFQFKFKRG
jgi:hypothetical protein